MKKQYIKPDAVEYKFNISSKLLAGSNGTISEEDAYEPAGARENDFDREDDEEEY